MKYNSFYFVVAILILIGLSSSGCDSLSVNEDIETDIPNGQILFELNANGNSSENTVTGTDGQVIEIHEVKFFVEELELDGTKGTKDFEVEDFIVTLSSNENSYVLADLRIPAGYYDEFELEIEKPDSDIHITDRDIRDESGRYSIVAKGLFNGEEFRFRTDKEIEIEKDLQPALRVSEDDPAALRIQVDAGSWFVAIDGSLLEPNDYGNLKQIHKNIKHSFKIKYNSGS